MAGNSPSHNTYLRMAQIPTGPRLGPDKRRSTSRSRRLGAISQLGCSKKATLMGRRASDPDNHWLGCPKSFAPADVGWCAGFRTPAMTRPATSSRPASEKRQGKKSREITVGGCGSTTGKDGTPMCYDIVTLNPATKRWNVSFLYDERGDGGGFRPHDIRFALRGSIAA